MTFIECYMLGMIVPGLVTLFSLIATKKTWDSIISNLLLNIILWPIWYIMILIVFIFKDYNHPGF